MFKRCKKMEPLKDYTVEFCYECNTDHIFHSECFIRQYNFIPNIWMKNKSIHKRNKWFEKISGE